MDLSRGSIMILLIALHCCVPIVLPVPWHNVSVCVFVLFVPVR